jgi:hypothetical protein
MCVRQGPLHVVPELVFLFEMGVEPTVRQTSLATGTLKLDACGRPKWTCTNASAMI